MRIETASRKSAVRALLDTGWIRTWGKATGILLYSAIALALGAYLHGSVNLRDLYHAACDLPRVVTNAGTGMLAAPEQMSLHIRFKHYERLAYQRQRALDIGTLVLTDDDYVPATVEFRGESVPIRMRLKGDGVGDHLTGDKWSFRIKTRGENTLMGMKQFSIHRPEARNYIYEWIYHQALAREDVLSLRYDFIRVSLNGKDLGIYALEEHFEKRLVEHNRRREGPIVRFDEGAAWEELIQQPFDDAKANGVGSYFVTGIDAFQTTQWLREPQLREVHNRAISLLAAFRNGERTTSEVFDIDKLASYFAVSDLVGAVHGSEWKNVRFYSNPITSRLEPIGFDGVGWRPSQGLSYMLRQHVTEGRWLELTDMHYYDHVFRDPVFLRKYMQKLEEVSQPDYVDRLLSEINEGLARNLAIIYAEFPGFDFSREMLHENQQYIRSQLHPTAPIIAYRERSTAGRVELRAGNPLPVPVEILGLSCGEVSLSPTHKTTLLPGKTEFSVIQFRPISFALPDTASGTEQLRVRYQVLGLDDIRHTSVEQWSYGETVPPSLDALADTPNDHEFDFVVRDEKRKRIWIRPGEWTLSQDLIIPPEYTLVATGGSVLNLTSSAAILSFSPVRLIGREGRPIVIESRDHTGRGLTVVNAQRPSTLSHVSFRNLSRSSGGQGPQTAAATFHSSPVAIDHCCFLENETHHGVRLVKSGFLLSDCVFTRTSAAGVSSLFCDGRIRETTFDDCRGDGIHVVGGDVEIQNVSLERVRGTGMVVGENSQFSVTASSVCESKAAVALQDMSFIKVRGLRITGCEVGILTRRQKPEYGPSNADLTGIELKSVETPYLIQDESIVRVEGVELDLSPRFARGVGFAELTLRNEARNPEAIRLMAVNVLAATRRHHLAVGVSPRNERIGIIVSAPQGNAVKHFETAESGVSRFGGV